MQINLYLKDLQSMMIEAIRMGKIQKRVMIIIARTGRSEKEKKIRSETVRKRRKADRKISLIGMAY